MHGFSTGAAKKTHDLGIELVPDVSDLLADEIVELDGFFDFFDRMDSSSVVFAAQLIGNLWKAHVELAAQQVHGNLPWYDDMLSPLSTTDFFAVDLEMAGSLVDNLLGGEVLGSTAPDVAK